MSLLDGIASEVISDGVKITTYTDGTQHFQTIDGNARTSVAERAGVWKKISDWWNSLRFTPYFHIKDLANPLKDRDDADTGSDGTKSAEIGVRVRF